MFDPGFIVFGVSAESLEVELYKYALEINRNLQQVSRLGSLKLTLEDPFLCHSIVRLQQYHHQ